MRRRSLLFLCAAFAAAASLFPAFSGAQGFPSRALALVSPFPAGSGNDLVARAIAPALAEALGQPVVVQNKPGAGGAVGAQFVANASPDGYTLFLASLSFSVLPSVQKLAFDPVKAFEAVSLAGEQQMVLVASASLSVGTMDELAAYAKARPGRLNYGSAGIGSIGHLAGELLKSERSLDIVHVPYKGTPEALTAIVAGDVQMGLIALPAAEPQIKAGKVKALAITGTKRYAGLPQVPTMAEAGMPSVGDSVWYAVLVPAGTPAAAIERLSSALREALTAPATVKRMERSARATPAWGLPQEARRFVRAQIAKWGAVAARAGLSPAK